MRNFNKQFGITPLRPWDELFIPFGSRVLIRTVRDRILAGALLWLPLSPYQHLPFSQLLLSTRPLLFCQLLSSSHSFVIYSLFSSSTHPINAPALHTKKLSFPSYRASIHFYRQQVPLAIVPFWFGGWSRHGCGLLVCLSLLLNSFYAFSLHRRLALSWPGKPFC